MRRALMLSVVALGVAVSSVVMAHPGRLDKQGCHHVHTRYVDQDSRTYEVGTYHCHRRLGEMKLDGREILLPDDEAVRQTERETPETPPRP